MLAALLHGTPAAGVSQTLRHRTRNGISQTVPPIFGWATITLGNGPHSDAAGLREMIGAHMLTERHENT